MKTLVKNHLEFCENFIKLNTKELNLKGVEILVEFLKNKKNILKFHKKFVEPYTPKIVLVGINPGRFGSGLTGIPFTDFNSLSKLLDDKTLGNKKEQSATFIFSIIESIGVENFFKNIYLTNLSAVGFVDAKNKKIKIIMIFQ